MLFHVIASIPHMAAPQSVEVSTSSPFGDPSTSVDIVVIQGPVGEWPYNYVVHGQFIRVEPFGLQPACSSVSAEGDH